MTLTCAWTVKYCHVLIMLLLLQGGWLEADYNIFLSWCSEMFARLPNSHMLLNTIHTFIQCRYVAYFLWNKQFRNSSQKRKTWEISQDVHSSPIVLCRYSLNIILHWPSRFLFLRILICSYFTSQFRNPKTFDVSPPWHGETKMPWLISRWRLLSIQDNTQTLLCK